MIINKLAKTKVIALVFAYLYLQEKLSEAVFLLANMWYDYNDVFIQIS
ncbi:hypothetical protein RV15_GL001372 [Enterococcus silesiacus]|uniref:Uncharacterized protein n=1 Tax=Enterococcus silesiacus TaxID=332949 RepID=A0AA91GNC0_9ENTE|nr:hypothetical protein RV15_GL001372 [Enterococcus silesiacus]